MATPSIRTTNGTPVSNAENMPALALFSAQINPHYIDGQISGYTGKLMRRRLQNFVLLTQNKL
ncbi:Type 1 glutamine amidotransferase-like domain-containing protein [Xenorhabdus mauleonii]|uniref:Type 1 glutamine amidotransferase-like domain-containing protein n=1 Tax=Xenorhabdus mauleonii TaxID=351675 RepID=UPI003B84819D